MSVVKRFFWTVAAGCDEVAVVERLKQERMYGLSAETEKSARCRKTGKMVVRGCST